MKFTRKGSHQLYDGDRLVSQHFEINEAYESAYRDAQAKPAGVYKYRVKPAETEIEVSTLSRVVLLSAPAGLAATVVSSSRIDLSWSPVVSAANYRVYRGGVAVEAPTAATHSSTGLAPSTLYQFAVSTVDGSGFEGPQSSGISASTFALPDTTAPTAPVISVSTVSSASQSVSLTTASTDSGGSGLASYELQRATNSGFTLNVVTTSVATSGFPVSVTGLSASTQYFYRCRALDVAGNVGSYSATVNATTNAGSGSTFAHGDSVTITGSGFGTMPTFFFAGGAAGQIEATAAGNTPSSSANQEGDSAPAGMNWQRFRNPVFMTVFNDSTRGKVVRFVDGTTDSQSTVEYKLATGDRIPVGGKFFIAYYARYGMADIGSPFDPQIKFTRINAGQTDIVDTQHNLLCTFLVNEHNLYLHSAGGTGTQHQSFSGANCPTLDNAWNFVTHKLTAPTSQGAANGRFLYRAQRTSAVQSYRSFTNLNAYTDSTRWGNFMWQNGWFNGFAGECALDDLFVQWGSFKCVQLWNNANPSLATLREIQEPTVWADGSITVRLNKGGLSAGDYTLVVLADSEADTVLASRSITVS